MLMTVRDVLRQRCSKRGSGYERRSDLTTERPPLKGEFDAHLYSARQPIARSQICTTCLFAESVGL